MSAGQFADSPASSAGPPAGDDEAEYRTDAFRMNSMKVLPCSKRFVHDWTECPFAHPQEKARRRDPRLHNYTGIACPSMKKEGCCAFGDHCPYAHNVFEYWLHPTRYRTQLCNDGSNCKRKICFFAHSLDELRVPACKPFVSPEALAAAAASAANDAEAKRKAATVGSPLASFAAMSPGPSPQRSSFDAARAAAAAAEARMSGFSCMAAPPSPGIADDAAAMQSSPADAAVHQALAQLAGAGFSSKDTQVIELVTSLLAQDRVSPEQAASILQQMLAPDALQALQARLNTPRALGEDTRCYSDPLGYRSDAAPPSPQTMRSSFDTGGPGVSPHMAAAMLGQQGRGAGLAQQQHPQGPSLEHLAAAQAAQQMGLQGAYPGISAFAQAQTGSLAQFQAPLPTGLPSWDARARLSLESARSSFDTARMSLERGSMDVGTPRGSLEAAFPSGMRSSGSLAGPFYSGQLSSVPEQFPMINAPPPSWGSARFSLESATAADRLGQDIGRMSFEAGASSAAGRVAPQTANPYASSFFSPSASAQPQPEQGGSAPPPPERRAMPMPPMPPLPMLRTPSSTRSPGPDEPNGAGPSQHHLVGGTAHHRLQ